MLDSQLTAKPPFSEFYKNPMNISVVDTTSQADRHIVYDRPSFLLLKQRYKKQQNIASINYNAVKNWWLTLSKTFLFILVFLMITQCFVNFGIRRNVYVVAIAVLNK
jgi:hypothetical protein